MVAPSLEPRPPWIQTTQTPPSGGPSALGPGPGTARRQSPPHCPHSPPVPGTSSAPQAGEVSEPGSLEPRPDAVSAFPATWAPDRTWGLQAQSPHCGAPLDNQASPSPGRPPPPSPAEAAGTAAGGCLPLAARGPEWCLPPAASSRAQVQRRASGRRGTASGRAAAEGALSIPGQGPDPGRGSQTREGRSRRPAPTGSRRVSGDVAGPWGQSLYTRKKG